MDSSYEMRTPALSPIRKRQRLLATFRARRLNEAARRDSLSEKDTSLAGRSTARKKWRFLSVRRALLSVGKRPSWDFPLFHSRQVLHARRSGAAPCIRGQLYLSGQLGDQNGNPCSTRISGNNRRG